MLKPGVAVDVRGASEDVRQDVINQCRYMGAKDGKQFYGLCYVIFGFDGFVYLDRDKGQCEVITIDQALGRTDNNWRERGELPPVGQIVNTTE